MTRGEGSGGVGRMMDEGRKNTSVKPDDPTPAKERGDAL